MKNLILFIILLCVVRLAAAQTRVTDVSQAPLKGKVKQVTTYTFRGGNHTVPDTTASAERTIETFDEKGWAIEEKMYDKNDALQERLSFEYIGDSIVVKKQFDASGKLFVKYIYKYDSQGKETEFDMKSDAQPQIRLAKIDYRCIYKYDEFGNRVSEEQYIDYDKLTMKTISRYNDRHQRIQSDEESFFGKAFKKSIVKYTCDNVGNPIKSEIYDANGHLTGGNDASYDKFDKYGNWLIGTSSYSGHSSYQGDFTFKDITKRVIEYY
ncbi:MAG: hypothetical protein ACXVB6_19515 [Mucilaginibacter sp.]